MVKAIYCLYSKKLKIYFIHIKMILIKNHLFRLNVRFYDAK